MTIAQAMVTVGECLGDLRGGFFGNPILLRGKVVEKPEYETESFLQALYKRVFGHDVVVDVEKALSIGRSGTTVLQPTRLGRETIEATRQVARRLSPGEEVLLVCNSVGRAIVVGSDVRDAQLSGAMSEALI